jgi:hypothetical protein
MTRESPSPEASGPSGVGGWLLLPVGGLLFAAIFGIWTISGIVTMPDALALALSFDPPSLSINLIGVLIFWALLPLIPLALLLMRSRYFPIAFIIVSVAGAVFGFASPLIEAIDYSLDTGALASVNTLLPAAWTAGWSWYMLKSVRVRNTFVN